jgi:hypothetical protein
MLASQIPYKVPIPFAEGSTLVNAPVPLAPPGGGRISWQQGFTALNMTPLASGGVPPFGQDMNAVLQAISAWSWWQAAGGPVAYDSAFSAENGGYPFGAVLQAANGIGWWFSTTDNNTSNPDTGGSNWSFVPLEQAYAGNPNGFVKGQAASASSPPSQLWDYTNGAFWICTFTGPAAGGPGVQAVWLPLTLLMPVNPSVTGNTYNYTGKDLGQYNVRSNAGAAMNDALPGFLVNGWWTKIRNGDSVAVLTISVPTGKSLNGVVNNTLTLTPGQTATVDQDASGNFWLEVPPIPQNFAPQEIYVNTSGTYGPGAYVIDTTAGSVTFTLEGSPQSGDNYSFRDAFGTFAKNPCVINPNGKTCDVTTLNVNWVKSYFIYKPSNWSQV